MPESFVVENKKVKYRIQIKLYAIEETLFGFSYFFYRNKKCFYEINYSKKRHVGNFFRCQGLHFRSRNCSPNLWRRQIPFKVKSESLGLKISSLLA